MLVLHTLETAQAFLAAWENVNIAGDESVEPLRDVLFSQLDLTPTA